MNGAEGVEGVEGVEGAEGVEGVEGVERVEGAERVPKWFQNGPQMVPKVAWKATGGAAGKAYVDQVAPQTGAGGTQKKKIKKKTTMQLAKGAKSSKNYQTWCHFGFKLVPKWSQNGPLGHPKP